MGEQSQRHDNDLVGCSCSLARACYSLRLHSDPREYLHHVMKATNMSCLTPEGAVSGDCDFLSANMYARSLFGECSPRVDCRAFLTLNIIRRGCPGEPECGADRDRYYHGARSDTEQDAGYRTFTWGSYHTWYALCSSWLDPFCSKKLMP